MIDSLQIENFRCFKRLNLNGLGQFNIVVGQNSGGKTALLESMFLPGGRQDLVFRLQAHRGMNQIAAVPIKTTYEALWKDLFFQFAQSEAIKISINGTAENSRTLKVFYRANSNAQLAIGLQKSPSNLKNPVSSDGYTPLVFETDVEGKKYLNEAVFNFSSASPNNPAGGFGLVLTGEPPPSASIAFLPTIAATYNLAAQFSEIDVKNEKSDFVSAMRKVFPIIEDISVQSTASMVPELYCTVHDVKEKVPVGLVSSGIHRFLNLMLSIASQRNGAVLVDEIENGIFYERLPEAWHAIVQMCKVYNVQLFASTHSKECLEGLEGVLDENFEEFRLLRAISCNGDGHSVDTFSGKDFRAALKVGADPRQATIS